MRIVDKSKKIPKLEDLWIEWQNLDLIKSAISLPNGIVITSWPTWSWKSTTLYAALSLLNKENVNIMTLEDPVENQVDWINQSQVKPPDLIHICLLTQNCIKTRSRHYNGLRNQRQRNNRNCYWSFFDMTSCIVYNTYQLSSWNFNKSDSNVNTTFLIPASFNAVIAQRLLENFVHIAKKIWVNQIDKDTLYNIQNALKLTKKTELTSRVSPEILKSPKFYEPVWCEHCDNTWYKWRVWLYEVLEMSDGVKEMVLNGQSAFNINKQAIQMEWYH